MEVSYKHLEERVIRQEVQARRPNLLFCGIAEDHNDTWLDCRRKVDRVMADMNMDIDPRMIKVDKVHRLGPPPPRSNFAARQVRPRPIIVAFNWNSDRDQVWRARSNLKGSPFHIEEDQPQEVEERRYRLLPIYNKAMSLPQFKSRTFINGDRLTINGVHYTVDNLDKLPKELDPRYIATRTDGKATVFFSINSPLSNHHPAKMNVEGIDYSCNEQYYFAKRAEAMGDEVIQDRVMNQSSPREMLKHGRKAVNHKPELDIEKEEYKIMARGVKEQFSQNAQLKSFLLDTAGTSIGESSKSNTRWGTGLHLHHKDCFDTNRWATNLLGEILVLQRELFING
jgi:hypothetical protein